MQCKNSIWKGAIFVAFAEWFVFPTLIYFFFLEMALIPSIVLRFIIYIMKTILAFYKKYI